MEINDELAKQGLTLIKPNRIFGDFFNKNISKIDNGARPRIIGYANESKWPVCAESLNASQKKLVESFGGIYDSSISAWVLLIESKKVKA